MSENAKVALLDGLRFGGFEVSVGAGGCSGRRARGEREAEHERGHPDGVEVGPAHEPPTTTTTTTPRARARTVNALKMRGSRRPSTCSKTGRGKAHGGAAATPTTSSTSASATPSTNCRARGTRTACAVSAGTMADTSPCRFGRGSARPSGEASMVRAFRFARWCGCRPTTCRWLTAGCGARDGGGGGGACVCTAVGGGGGGGGGGGSGRRAVVVGRGSRAREGCRPRDGRMRPAREGVHGREAEQRQAQNERKSQAPRHLLCAPAPQGPAVRSQIDAPSDPPVTSP